MPDLALAGRHIRWVVIACCLSCVLGADRVSLAQASLAGQVHLSCDETVPPDLVACLRQQFKSLADDAPSVWFSLNSTTPLGLLYTNKALESLEAGVVLPRPRPAAINLPQQVLVRSVDSGQVLSANWRGQTNSGSLSGFYFRSSEGGRLITVLIEHAPRYDLKVNIVVVGARVDYSVTLTYAEGQALCTCALTASVTSGSGDLASSFTCTQPSEVDKHMRQWREGAPWLGIESTTTR